MTRWIAARGMRCTRERLAVLEEVQKAGQWFSPADIRDALMNREEAFTVSLTTVYSTLQLLDQAGLVRSRVFDNHKGVVYEMATLSVRRRPERHSHVSPAKTETPCLVCRGCGRIRKLRDASEALAGLHSVRLPGFRPDSFQLTIYGFCSACQRKSKSKRAKSASHQVFQEV